MPQIVTLGRVCVFFSVQNLCQVQQVRGFAAVKLHGLSGRYATSLYTVAQNAKQLPVIESELASLTRNLDECAEMSALFSDPSISVTQQKAGLGAAMDKGGFSDTMKNFLGESSRPARCSAAWYSTVSPWLPQGLPISHTAWLPAARFGYRMQSWCSMKDWVVPWSPMPCKRGGPLLVAGTVANCRALGLLLLRRRLLTCSASGLRSRGH